MSPLGRTLTAIRTDMGQTQQPRVPRLHTLPQPPKALVEHLIGGEFDLLGDDHLAFALVLVLRDLNTWVEASPAERPLLLGPAKWQRTSAMAYAARAVPEIAPALETI